MARSTPARTKKQRGTPKERGTRAARSTAAADAANAWRQRVSKDAATTIDAVVAHVLAVVEEQLGRHGQFPAFLVTARRDGEYELDTLPAEQLAELAPAAALQALRDKAAAVRDGVLCAAVAFPATLPDRSGQSAVAAQVEHREGEALTVLRPYRLRGAERSVGFDDVVVEPAESWLWP